MISYVDVSSGYTVTLPFAQLIHPFRMNFRATVAARDDEGEDDGDALTVTWAKKKSSAMLPLPPRETTTCWHLPIGLPWNLNVSEEPGLNGRVLPLMSPGSTVNTADLPPLPTKVNVTGTSVAASG